MTKREVETFLKKKLSKNNAWALRALEVVYSFQTVDERAAHRTMHHNNVGFTGTDSEFLSSIASQHKSGRPLSQQQYQSLRKLIPKYWHQLYEVSDKVKLERTYLRDSNQMSLFLGENNENN